VLPANTKFVCRSINTSTVRTIPKTNNFASKFERLRHHDQTYKDEVLSVLAYCGKGWNKTDLGSDFERMESVVNHQMNYS